LYLCFLLFIFFLQSSLPVDAKCICVFFYLPFCLHCPLARTLVTPISCPTPGMVQLLSDWTPFRPLFLGHLVRLFESFAVFGRFEPFFFPILHPNLIHKCFHPRLNHISGFAVHIWSTLHHRLSLPFLFPFLCLFFQTTAYLRYDRNVHAVLFCYVPLFEAPNNNSLLPWLPYANTILRTLDLSAFTPASSNTPALVIRLLYFYSLLPRM